MAKIFLLMAAAVACGTLLIGRAQATPSTLIWIPSTDVQPAGVTHLGDDSYITSSGATMTDIGPEWGTGKVEYGVDYLYATGIRDPLRLNGKISLVDEAASAPKVVAGVYDLGGTAASNIFYVLGSKTFAIGRFHAGFGIGKKDVLGADNGMLLLGYDKYLSDKWWIGADYQSGKSSFGALNAGVAYNFTPNTSLIVGYDWYNNGAPGTLTTQWDVNF